MDKIKIERTWLQGSPVQVDNLMGNAFVGEAGAHEFLISGKDNAGNVVPITGTITGKFLSSTMTTFALSGYVAEGVASVTLPSECYGAPGQFVVSIFATNGSTTTCIYCGVGSIFRTSTAAIAYPTTTLPDLTLLINQLDDVIASFPADLSHLLGAIAPTFVDNQPFTAGQYVWYNQVLYRFTVDHPAGSWAGSADTVVAVIGTELNSTVRYTQQVLTDAQKTVARTNIDAADADDVTDLELTTVQVTPQTFDDNSKSQARSNIGAASSGDLNTLSTLVNNQGGYISDLNATIGTVPAGETVEGQITDLKSAIDVLEPAATAEDVGKTLIAKTVANGKVSEYEFGVISEGLTEAAKVALLNCFQHVAWADEHGQDYYDDLHDALYPDTSLSRISAVFTQGSFVVYPNTPLADLKAYLTVTGYYRDGTSGYITDYALTGTLAVGTSTITVECQGLTDTFTVTVQENPEPVWGEEVLYISGYDSNNASVTYNTTMPYMYKSPSTPPSYEFDQDDGISAIAGDFTVTGSLSIGYYTGTIDVNSNFDSSKLIVKETINIDVTGYKKYILSAPMIIPNGSYLAIGAWTEAPKWKYGDNGTPQGFYYQQQFVIKSNSRSLGLNIYTRQRIS